MNILAISHHPSLEGYGAERSHFRICKGLVEHGHDLTLLYLRDGDLVDSYKKICRFVKRVPELHVYGIKKFLASLPFFIWQALNLPGEHYDAIYVNQYNAACFGLVLGAVKHIPVVCHHRDRLPPHPSRLFPAVFPHVAMNIFVSGATQREWVDGGVVKPERGVVVYNGVAMDSFKPSEDPAALRHGLSVAPEEKLVLYVGRLDPDKGVDTLLRGFAKAHATDPALRLWLAGDASLDKKELCKEGLERLSADLRISQAVRFLGFQGDVLPYYQACDLVVLPSVVQECFGRTLVEAMACGKPALGSRIGGIPEVLSGQFSNCLFTPGNPSELAQLILLYTQMSREKPRFGDDCRRHVVENFPAEKMVEGVERVLRSAAIKR